MEALGSFAVAVESAVDSEADKSAAADVELEAFAGLVIEPPELVLEPELASVSKSDTVVAHTFAAVECKSAVAECS